MPLFRAPYENVPPELEAPLLLLAQSSGYGISAIKRAYYKLGELTDLYKWVEQAVNRKEKDLDQFMWSIFGMGRSQYRSSSPLTIKQISRYLNQVVSVNDGNKKYRATLIGVDIDQQTVRVRLPENNTLQTHSYLVIKPVLRLLASLREEEIRMVFDYARHWNFSNPLFYDPFNSPITYEWKLYHWTIRMWGDTLEIHNSGYFKFMDGPMDGDEYLPKDFNANRVIDFLDEIRIDIRGWIRLELAELE